MTNPLKGSSFSTCVHATFTTQCVGGQLVICIPIFSFIVIPFGFEQSPYTFEEADLLVDTVFVTKGDVVSEQNHTVLVQFSSNNLAEPGKCKSIIDYQQEYT